MIPRSALSTRHRRKVALIAEYDLTEIARDEALSALR